jgi:tetratricopeptide (TPR) repeat protein
VIIGAVPLLFTSLGLNQVAVPTLLKGKAGWRDLAAQAALAWAASLAAVALVLILLSIALRFGLLNQALENFVGAAVLQLLRGDLSLIATLLVGTLIPALAWTIWLRMETMRWQRRLASDQVATEEGDSSVIQGLARFVAVAAGLSLVLLVLYVLDLLPGTDQQPDPDVALFAATGVVFAALAVGGLAVFVWLRRGKEGAGAGTLGLELPLVASLMFGVILAFTLRQDVVTIANGLYGPGELAAFDRASALFPELASAHYLKGERLWFQVPAVVEGGELTYDQDGLREVHDSFARAIEADPTFAPSYFGRGTTRIDLDDPQGALEDANTLIELKPDHPAGYAMRARAWLEIGDVDQAVADLARALAPLPEDTRAWDAYWARCLALDGSRELEATAPGIPGDPAERLEEAIIDCERSLELNDQHAPTFDELGFLYFDAGRYEDALRVYDEFVDVAPGPRAFTNRAVTLMYLGRYDEALPDLNEAIAELPDYAKAYRLRAETWLYLDDSAQALADADRSVELQPDSAESQITRAVVAMYTGQTEAALASADQLAALGLDEAVVRNVRGYAYALAGDDQRALEDLDRAVVLQPTSPSALDSRGYARYLAGDFAGALADVEQALDLVPEYNRMSRSEYLYHRALIRDALGDRAGSEADARDALSLTPLPLVRRSLEDLLDS